VNFRDGILKTLPPLAGIANGAMVLQDQFFANMTYDQLQISLGPKIVGSINLDEVFNDLPLDWFIVFSSLASVVGNRGQSNYGAANMFMVGLAKQRRARGLAGSAINIGRMVGVGFIEHTDHIIGHQLDKVGFMPVSEVDLIHMFAQAIMSGLPDSAEDPDIITGLRIFTEDEAGIVPWFHNPRFSHIVVESQEDNTKAKGQQTSRSLQNLLKEARTEAEVLEALQGKFSFLSAIAATDPGRFSLGI
jgi:hybrid polyketide synthase/nonribosomal peptide synthetase ACE1